jgi:hypothetical protein
MLGGRSDTSAMGSVLKGAFATSWQFSTACEREDFQRSISIVGAGLTVVAALNDVGLVHVLVAAARDNREALRLEGLAQDTVSGVCKSGTEMRQRDGVQNSSHSFLHTARGEI